MSAPVLTDFDDRGRDTPSMFPPTMYAPPWARDAVTDAADAALAATETLRRALPAAPQLDEPRARRREAPFDGDVAIQALRERSPLDPVAMPAPPERRRGTAVSVLAPVAGAVGLAALAALFMVGTPGSLPAGLTGEGGVKPLSRAFGAAVSREAPAAIVARKAEAEFIDPPALLMERFSAAVPMAEPPVMAMTPPPSEPAVSLSPPARALDPDEIATLYKRGEKLIAQGDIAAARLMFARAAEVGDARSALALGASYDPDVLRKLGVIGVAADAARAREWYAKASEFGSGEAAQRIERLAQRN